MSKITSRSESIRISLDLQRKVNIRLGRDKETVLSVDSLEIRYSYGETLVNGKEHFLWRVSLHGWYPLDKPEAVCACSPGIHKTKQGHSKTYRGEYERDVLDCPYWVREIVIKHCPAWFVFEGHI